ncbi:MAG: ATP-dependent RNA helicase RhlE, partial [Oleiphilaceae bacterium]
TPGRLLEMIYARAIHFDELEVLALDEADRMLDMGFIDDINKIIERLPSERQSLLFSATLTDDVRFLAKTVKSDALEISISPKSTSAPSIDQWLITVDKDKKSALLSHLILDKKWNQVLIFIETKHGAAKLVSQLGKRGIQAESIHGDRSQAMRSKILSEFKSGEIRFLVATGVAARGIDIGKLTRVVNYDLPFKPEEYIHRIGRTGRAGASGEAISFVAMGDFKNLCAIESRLGHIIIRKEIEGFPVRKTVPISILNYVRKAKKPSKNTSQQVNRAPSKEPSKNPDSSSKHKAENRNDKDAKGINQHIWGK